MTTQVKIRIKGDFEKSGVILEKTVTLAGAVPEVVSALLKEIGTLTGRLMWDEDLTLADVQAQMQIGNPHTGYRWENMTADYMANLRKLFVKGETIVYEKMDC